MENEVYKKDYEYNEDFCLKVSVPVKYKVKQKYILYEDEFGNPYYEKDYDGIDYLEEAYSQNPVIKEIIEYLKTKGCKIYEEGF